MRYIESKISDAEFERKLEQKRFLHQCKRDKFKGLYAAGLLQKARPYMSDDETRKRIVEEARERIEAGEMLDDIAKEVGWSRQSISDWARALGNPLPRSVNIKPFQIDEIIHQVNELGHGYTKTLKEIGVSAGGVRYALAKRGLYYNGKTKTIDPCEN